MQAQRSDAMEYNPVVWFEIYVDDMKRAKTFYEGLLDVALEEAKIEGVGCGFSRMISAKPVRQGR